MSTATKPKTKHPNEVWDDMFYVKAFELCSIGASPTDLLAALGISKMTLHKWLRTKPAFKDAVDRGRKVFTNGQEKTSASGHTLQVMPSLEEYCYGRLPQELQEFWDEVQKVDEAERASERYSAMFRQKGKMARMQLYIHAMVASDFCPSEAMRMTSVSSREVQDWARHDPRFGELLDELKFHKKNFFEKALVRLVRRGDPSAIIFANRTINRDRGYNEKVDISVIQKEDDKTVEMDVLAKLPLNVRLQVLEAMEKGEAYDPGAGVMDAEVVTEAG